MLIGIDYEQSSLYQSYNKPTVKRGLIFRRKGMFEINGGAMVLGSGDLKAYGGSKHGQVLRHIECDDWRGQSFGEEYSFLQLQQFVIVGERKVKLLHVVLVPNGISLEQSEHYETIRTDAEKAMAETKSKLIQ